MDEERPLPTIEEVAGQFDLTGGLSVEEHRERLSAPRLFDEVERLRQQNARLRAALRLACQDMRGPGVPIDDLVADYLRAVDPDEGFAIEIVDEAP